jgi:hypothetical protein
MVALAIFRRGAVGIGRFALFAYLFFAAASHGVLDAITNGGLGVAFFSPFDKHSLFPALETCSRFTNCCHSVFHAARDRHP